MNQNICMRKPQNKQTMKTFRSIAIIALTGLMLMATQSHAQRGNRGNRMNRNNTCYQNIPNLTEQQSQQIQEWRTAHLNKMAELRQERRSTSDPDQKSAIRDQMLQKQESHKNQVRALLNDEQKSWFDANYQKYQQNRSGRGNGNRGSRGRGNRGGNRSW